MQICNMYALVFYLYIFKYIYIYLKSTISTIQSLFYIFLYISKISKIHSLFYIDLFTFKISKIDKSTKTDKKNKL
jgi:hypothetical protein